MKLQPLSNYVLVNVAKADSESKGGILLPDNARETPRKGEVLAVGPGKVNDDGRLQPMSLKVGEVVLFNRYGTNEVEVEGVTYTLISEDNILAKLEGGKK